jgi:hypothetical protein
MFHRAPNVAPAVARWGNGTNLQASIDAIKTKTMGAAGTKADVIVGIVADKIT